MDVNTHSGLQFNDIIPRLTYILNQNLRFLQLIPIEGSKGLYEEKNKLGLYGSKLIYRLESYFWVSRGGYITCKLKIHEVVWMKKLEIKIRK